VWTLFGCASSYNGLGPNLFVREPGEIALEKQKFHLSAPSFAPGYNLGGRRYTSGTVLPIVTAIDPAAARTTIWGARFLNTGLATAIVGTAAWFASKPDNRCLLCAPALFTVAGVGLFTFGAIKIGVGVQQYNKTLGQSFQLQKEF
jgi:hypothetical protein